MAVNALAKELSGEAIDVLICNAGIGGERGNASFGDVNQDIDTLAVPLTGTYTLLIEGRFTDAAGPAGNYTVNVQPVVVASNLLLLVLKDLLVQSVGNLDVGGLPGSKIGGGINSGSLGEKSDEK